MNAIPSAQPSSTVLVERHGPVARLIIDRPPLNILDVATLRELRLRLAESPATKESRLIELRGAGEKAFSAGVEIRDHFPDRAPELLEEFHRLIRIVLDAPAPVIAVIRGHCLGGGMELALASDFVIASEDARFGQPEIRVGCIAPVASVLLPRMMPERKALELLLTGGAIDAAEAARMGLANRVAAPERLEEEVEKFENELLAHSTNVLALARKAVRGASRHGIETALREAERIYRDELLGTEDAVEGLRAFIEKRPPKWKGP